MGNTVREVDKVFAGSIPQLYEQYLVPLIFQPYAANLAQRLRSRTMSRVLEIAAGTGVVTRALATALIGLGLFMIFIGNLIIRRVVAIEV